MHPPRADTVLVRYGEIGVKSDRVQRRMAERLRGNLQAAVVRADDENGPRTENEPQNGPRTETEPRVDVEHTRLYVRTTPERVEAVTEAVTDTFGVVSASPTVRVEPTLDAIGDALAETAAARYDGGTFAVRARRAGSDEAHPFSSADVEQEGGNAVWEQAQSAGITPEVDLDDPDMTFFVECRPTDGYVFLEKRSGPGGLPLGTQQPLLALVSGGIDSPVAAWEAMKRGCPVYPLYVDLGDYGGVDNRLRAEQAVETLRRYVPDGDLALRVAPGGEGIDRIVETVETCRMVVVRRFMFRIAERIAESLDAAGIVTGESIGQKSSQTSASLRVTSVVTELPVHRPLATRDKSEVSEQARAIGTYDDSTIRTGCHRLAPEQPATQPPLSTVRDVAPDDVDRLAAEAADRVWRVGH
jgi:thiamine biosynthesis protein ThiI